jgi:hypothetical protein
VIVAATLAAAAAARAAGVSVDTGAGAGGGQTQGAGSAAGARSGGKWDAAPVEVSVKEMTDDDERVEIVVTADKKKRDLIDLMAKFVAGDGEAFEKVSQSVCVFV